MEAGKAGVYSKCVIYSKKKQFKFGVIHTFIMMSYYSCFLCVCVSKGNLRVEGVVWCTDCKVLWDKSVILVSINEIDLT